jgi:hypothetical protein
MHEPYTSSIQCVIREWLREDRGVSGGNGGSRRGSGAHYANPDDENEEVVVVATLKWQ